jgi:DNA-binding transcriptional LysR family regulator
MRFNKLDLNLLVALDALLTEQNVTRAGNRLHISQSSMSGALARLREYFGDELFVPIGRKLMPTPLAESLINPVRNVLLQIESTVLTKPEFDPAVAVRHFKMLISDFSQSILMTRLLPKLHIQAPHITLEFLLQINNPFEELERGDVDFLIIPENYTSSVQPKASLFDETYVCVVWNGNTLVGDTLTFEQYRSMGHAIAQFGRAHYTFETWFHDEYGYTLNAEISTGHLSGLSELVVGTNRIATVHRMLAQKQARYLPIRLLEPPMAVPPLRQTLQWHHYHDSDPGNQWMRNLIIETAHEISEAHSQP